MAVCFRSRDTPGRSLLGGKSDVTRLLAAAAADLLPLACGEQRKLAARMAAEPSGHTFQSTALVHEAHLRLVGPADDVRRQTRGHFFAADFDLRR